MWSQPGSSDRQRQMPEQSTSHYWQPSSHPGSYNSFAQVPSHMGRPDMQFTIDTQHDVDGIVDQNIPNRGKRQQIPSKYLVTPFTVQASTTMVPKQRVSKSKNKGKTANLSPLNNPHVIGTLDGSTRPYPSWNDVDWVLIFFESPTLENKGPFNQEIPSSHLNNSYNKTSFLNNGISFDLGGNNFHISDSLHLQNEPHFSNHESSFDFRSNEYNTYDVVNENPQNKIHKWQKFMSFEPDISKQYSQQSEVEKGKIFENKESLILAVRLKALSEGFQFVTDRSDPERCYLKCYHFTECDWYLRATLWDNTKKYYITYLNDVHTCSKTQTYPNHRNANKKVIGHLLTPKLQDRSRNLRGKDIQQDILLEYKIHISYQQAMKGKHYGSYDHSNYHARAYDRCLSILKGIYKETNLVLWPWMKQADACRIAFGISEGETVHGGNGGCPYQRMHCDNPNLLFISERHAVIKLLAVEKESL
ncbi:hypothetical protein Tco_0415463 [Tanacetum coccineum]